MELSWNGAEPLELPGGGHRTFLEDGDEVVLRGEGLGEVRGRIEPALCYRSCLQADMQAEAAAQRAGRMPRDADDSCCSRRVRTLLAVLPAGAAAQGETATRSRSRPASARSTPTSRPTGRATTSRRASRTWARTRPTPPGEPIDPAIEAANQPNCTPLPNWRFTLGKGYISRAVSGPWGSLSIVTDPYNTDIVTLPETPLLDANGADTRDTIEGAVTIELTEGSAQAGGDGQLAVAPGRHDHRPDPEQGLPRQVRLRRAALRDRQPQRRQRRVDLLPSGQRAVFCYAYYVTPPPTSGRIVIRKRVAGGASQVFNFDGNLSFNEGGEFSITLNNQESASTSEFFRAAGETWTARELVPTGWSLTDISCVTPRGSTWDGNLAAAEVSITLAARDLVVCTFTNAVTPPDGQLFIEKITRGAPVCSASRSSPAAEINQRRRPSRARKSRTCPWRRSPAR